MGSSDLLKLLSGGSQDDLISLVQTFVGMTFLRKSSSEFYNFRALVAPQSIEWTEGIGPDAQGSCRSCTDILVAFREQALEVFYGPNVFMATSEEYRTVDDNQDIMKVDHQSALAFIMSVPKEVLRHLRSLLIMFSSYASMMLPPGLGLFAIWREALEYMETNLSLSRSSVTI
ncbi:uncharacterized protein A1O9_06076 [Exophiala aquamarina CBS 119918]|uniref:Uncharacterized protein n=1 Tax=Exophiala aquamarina CBS 119918 TaxID=1182545 RepID=A0A072PEF7_9EURO|nr:uncharacterized protein A1O9_06076 [Exophiala aquamarina CBS 119918]KEF58152.1 hypothetical protein A1O9_06076 [Exophiala aquamarina CBS 119918]